MVDTAATLTRAIEQADALVSTTPSDRLGDPTPCEEYRVADLISHLVLIANRVTAVSTGALGEYPVSPTESRPAQQWQTAYIQTRKAIVDANQDKIVDLPFGRMPLGGRLRSLDRRVRHP